MDQEQNIAPALAACTEEERQEAMGRFAVLRPHINDGVPLPEAARDAGVPLRSVQRWLARYRATGLAGLVRAKRSDTGQRKLPAELVDLIEGMALRKPRPSVAAIHRRMRELATKRKGTPPSYSSVYGIVRHLNPAMVTLAQDGPAAFRDRYELIYRHRAEGPNAIWQADHTLLDILVLDANGEAVRPWLTIIIDDYSRAVAGYTIFLGAPTALQTALALRQAIWSKPHAAWPVCGIPDVLHVEYVPRNIFDIMWPFVLCGLTARRSAVPRWHPSVWPHNAYRDWSHWRSDGSSRHMAFPEHASEVSVDTSHAWSASAFIRSVIS